MPYPAVCREQRGGSRNPCLQSATGVSTRFTRMRQPGEPRRTDVIHPLYSEAHRGCGRSCVSNMSKKQLRKHPWGAGRQDGRDRARSRRHRPAWRTPERGRSMDSSLVPHAFEGPVMRRKTERDEKRLQVRKTRRELNTAPCLIKGLAAPTHKVKNRRSQRTGWEKTFRAFVQKNVP